MNSIVLYFFVIMIRKIILCQCVFIYFDLFTHYFFFYCDR